MNKLSVKERKAFKETAKRVSEAVDEIIDHCLLTEDVDELGRLVTQIDILQGYEVQKTLRDKGLAKEITELCDKAGRIK